jgi:hypothetical protein
MRPWVVCEAGDRWLHTVRRFAPEIMPSPLTPASIAAQPSDVPQILASGLPAVVLWEVERESLAIACDHIARAAVTTPEVLQLVAGPQLSGREQIAVSEFGCAASIRHPEDLPGLSALIRGYFARSLGNLD